MIIFTQTNVFYLLTTGSARLTNFKTSVDAKIEKDETKKKAILNVLKVYIKMSKSIRF